MNYQYYNDENVDVIKADTAIIKTSEITEDQHRYPFSLILFIFLTSALSVAVALAYNNFSQSLISKYSFGQNGITATFINLILFTAIAVGILYLLWKIDPNAINKAIV